MSDTEGDSFDREAEREKLREQFEREERQRESTQHMSELLLKGATMTNRHCDECGDPIFRYQGRSFCPTCEREVEAGSAGAAAEAGVGEAAGAGEGVDRISRPEGGETGADPDGASDAGAVPSEALDRTAAAGGSRARPTGAEGDLDAARAAILGTVSRLADRIGETEDVGRLRDLLGAVREAGEALSALEAARRR